jgi:ABC-type antimicrobial peptide transport system permease subunit
VTPTDPVAIAGAVLLLLVVALAAGLVPSAGAARLNPRIALRTD